MRYMIHSNTLYHIQNMAYLLHISLKTANKKSSRYAALQVKMLNPGSSFSGIVCSVKRLIQADDLILHGNKDLRKVRIEM